MITEKEIYPVAIGVLYAMWKTTNLLLDRLYREKLKRLRKATEEREKCQM